MTDPEPKIIDWSIVDIWYPDNSYPAGPDHKPGLAILFDDGNLRVEPLPIIEVDQ